MSNPSPKNLKPKAAEPITCKAVTLFKQTGTDFLTVAYELTVVDGVVTEIKVLNSADMPASSIGRASSSLWNSYRTQSEPAK